MASTSKSTSLWAAVAAAFILGPLAFGLASCKKPGPTCDPEDEDFEAFRIVVGPADQINLDADGNPRATVVKIFQLTDDRILDTVTFEELWKDAPTALGENFLEEQEYVAYPDKPEVHELKPNPDAKFLVAAALFREPVGNTWYTSWDVPQFHGYQACAAKKTKKPFGDPCFYVGLERNELDGGHEPPVDFNGAGLDVVCPGKPLMVKPPEEKSDKEKRKDERKEKRKKRREKLKKGAEGTQEKAEQGKAANDKANAGADAATTKPEAPSVPGQD